jgi:hypothetical protein
LDTLSSKLHFFFPFIFSSLTSWEKLTLDNSDCLSHPSSQDPLLERGGIDSSPTANCKNPIAQDVSKLTVPEPGHINPLTFPSSYPSSSAMSTRTVNTNLRSVPHHLSSLVFPLLPNCLPNFPSIPVSPSTSSQIEDLETVILPGFRESEEGTPDLSLELYSLVPNFWEIKETTILPTYLGKRILEPMGSLEATSSKNKLDREGKSYAWLRDISLEISPINTRSCWKRLSQSIEQTTEIPTSSIDIGTLRAMKAPARKK